MFAIPLLVVSFVYCVAVYEMSRRIPRLWRRSVALLVGPVIPVAMGAIDHVIAGNVQEHYWAAGLAGFVCGAVVRLEPGAARMVRGQQAPTS